MPRLSHPDRPDLVVDVDGSDTQLLAYYAGEGYVEHTDAAPAAQAAPVVEDAELPAAEEEGDLDLG